MINPCDAQVAQLGAARGALSGEMDTLRGRLSRLEDVVRAFAGTCKSTRSQCAVHVLPLICTESTDACSCCQRPNRARWNLCVFMRVQFHALRHIQGFVLMPML